MDAKKPKLWKFSGPDENERRKWTNIFQAFSMEKLLDKESLLDCTVWQGENR